MCIEENKTLKPDFWDDSSKAQIVLKKIKFLKNWVDNIIKLSENISDLEILLDFNKNNECSDEELLNQYNSGIQKGHMKMHLDRSWWTCVHENSR